MLFWQPPKAPVWFPNRAHGVSQSLRHSGSCTQNTALVLANKTFRIMSLNKKKKSLFTTRCSLLAMLKNTEQANLPIRLLITGRALTALTSPVNGSILQSGCGLYPDHNLRPSGSIINHMLVKTSAHAHRKTTTTPH